MTVNDDLEGLVTGALARLDKEGPEAAGAWFLSEFQTRSGVPELVSDDRVTGLLYAATHGRETFESALRWMVRRALQQQPKAS